MKKMNNRVILATSLALSLVGCNALAPSQMAPRLGTTATSATQAMGSVNLTVKWPAMTRSAQAMPGRTQAVVLVVKQNGVEVGSPKVLKRSEAAGAMKAGTYGGLTSTLDMALPVGTGYVIEAKAYEQATDLLPPTPAPSLSPSATSSPDASASPAASASPTPSPAPTATPAPWVAPTAIAVGTSGAFEVRAGSATSVGISMSVANAPSIVAPAVAAAARGATVSITAANLGADATLVKAAFRSQYGSETALEVVSVAADGGSAVLRFPTMMNGDGSGKLCLYVDGIKTNEVDFALVNEIQADSSSLLSSTEQLPNPPYQVTTYYMLAGQAMTLPVQGTYWNNGSQTTVSNLPVTVTVKDGATDLPSAVGPSGAITLPTVGTTYTVTVALGELTKTFTIKAVSLSFTAPSISQRKVSKLNISGQTYDSQYQLTVPGYLNTGGSAVYLRSSDYNWTYSTPGLVSAQPNDWGDANTAKTLNFQATDTPGTTTVTATLKMDPTKTFSFSIMNVGIKGFNLYPSTLNLRAGATASVQAKVVLTDNVEINPVDQYGWAAKFDWNTSDVNFATVERKPNSNNWSNDGNGFGIVRAGSNLGNGTINLFWSDNNNASASLPVAITDDGTLNLTIQ